MTTATTEARIDKLADEVMVEQYQVTMSEGRDYSIERPLSFPRIFQVFAAGEYVGEAGTLVAAVGMTGDIDTDTPYQLLGRTVSRPTIVFRPSESVEPEGWSSVTVRGLHGTVATHHYYGIVGRTREGSPRGYTRAWEGATPVARFSVPDSLVDVFANRLLLGGAAVSVEPSDEGPGLTVERAS